MGAVGSVDTQCGHLAPCVLGADKLIAKLGQAGAKVQYKPFLASAVDMVVMMNAPQKTSWSTSLPVIPSPGRGLPDYQKSG